MRQREPARAGARRNVIQSVVPTMIAQAGGLQRLLPEMLFEIALEKRVQFAVLRSLGECRGRRRQKTEGAEDCQPDGVVHDFTVRIEFRSSVSDAWFVFLFRFFTAKNHREISPLWLCEKATFGNFPIWRRWWDSNNPARTPPGCINCEDKRGICSQRRRREIVVASKPQRISKLRGSDIFRKSGSSADIV